MGKGPSVECARFPRACLGFLRALLSQSKVMLVRRTDQSKWTLGVSVSVVCLLEGAGPACMGPPPPLAPGQLGSSRPLRPNTHRRWMDEPENIQASGKQCNYNI